MERTEIKICAMRGRYESAKLLGVVAQKLEIQSDRVANCITTVSKDCLAIGRVIMDEEKTLEDYLYTAKDGEQYGIFKLSPRECGRLMDVSDEDITKMLAVNSASQCYKQFGNSIVVNVLVAIFGQLFEGKEHVYEQTV